MSQDDGPARDRDDEGSKADGEGTLAPRSGSTPLPPESDSGVATLRRAKLVLADSTPPPPPVSEIDIDFGPPLRAFDQAPDSEQPVDAYLDKVIADKYVVEAYLGRGSMGTVYRCRHRVLDKPFAVKILRQELARDAEAVSRFVTEAKAASAIGSKHIVEVLDFGELPDGAAYIVMEYLEGATLYRDLCDSPQLPMERTLSIGIQVADALSVAHQAGVVHRDLKPDNVFLTRSAGKDFVKILDFGIAKVLRSGSKLTQAGSVMGTPAYMSPEQALGTATDARTDIYALGIMLYEMASGEVPFDAETPLAVLSKQVTEEPVKLSKRLSQELPQGYEAVVLKCLAKQPDQRFQSMAEVKTALEAIAAGSVPSVAPAPPLSKRTLRGPIAAMHTTQDAPEVEVEVEELAAPSFGRKPIPRWWWAAGAVAAALLLGGILLGVAGGKKQAAASASVSVAPPPPPAPVVSAAPIENLKEVHLILFPLDSHAFDGKVDLGMMPITISLKPGEVKHVQISRRGYVTRK
ncbi:MAG TPA: serine/threonine-protein kinase, partial [Polyangiaceae bacterium]|nr:serine/threonine-protein kinase [Polyangiaceae bacterium]